MAISEPTISIDTMSALFKQERGKTCGAAAISYLLTLLGDTIFERNAILQMSPLVGDGYSLLQLAALARSRGFTAVGYSGQISDLPSEGQTPVIAHLEHGHFVVVLFKDKESITVMDPAIGRIKGMHLSEFSRKWSGRYLKVLPSAGTTQ